MLLGRFHVPAAFVGKFFQLSKASLYVVFGQLNQVSHLKVFLISVGCVRQIETCLYLCSICAVVKIGCGKPPMRKAVGHRIHFRSTNHSSRISAAPSANASGHVKSRCKTDYLRKYLWFIVVIGGLTSCSRSCNATHTSRLPTSTDGKLLAWVQDDMIDLPIPLIASARLSDEAGTTERIASRMGIMTTLIANACSSAPKSPRRRSRTTLRSAKFG